jgi:methyl-accepting chemotaxis protein
MDSLSHLRLRTKLTLLLGLSAFAVIASIGLAASQLHDRMLSDRIDKLRTATQMFIGLAQSLDKQIAAGKLTRDAAVTRLRETIEVMHFDDGDGYVTFQTTDHLVLAHGGNPALDGKIASGKDAQGRNTADLAEAALAKADSGVIWYSAPKPGHTEPLAKVAYVERFAPWRAVCVAASYTDDLDAAFGRDMWRLSAAGGIVLLLTLIVGWLVNRDIAASLGALKAAMEQLASGALSIVIPGTKRRDEVGGMAGAVLVFQRHMEKAASLSSEKEAERGRTEAEKQAALMGMADKIETETGTALTQIGERTAALARTASFMAESATHTGAMARDAAEAAGQALATAQTVASAAEQLAMSIQEIGGQVNQSSAVAGRAVAASEDTRATIAALNEQVGQIGQVADMIREIAARTNLLALNATIEAARAGDAGRGFAVVASEVKQLATQTARSTEEITRRIGEVRDATGASVAAVARIEQTIAEINSIAGSIAAAVEQQGAATAEIARNVAETAAAADIITHRTGDVSAEAVRTGEFAAAVDRDTAALGVALGDLRQSVVRVVRTSTAEVDRRASARHETNLACRVTPSGGVAVPVRVTDLSEGGARLADGPDMRDGQRGTLDIPGAGSALPFQVRRAGGGTLHVAFDPEAAREAGLRSLVEQLARRRAA